MRLVLYLLGRTLVDLSVLEPEAGEQSSSLDCGWEAAPPPPFGFRPDVDPIPWERR